MAKEVKSKKYSGIFFRELANGDRSYFLRIRINGKMKRFPIGKKSEGITEAFCNQEKIRIINEAKFGEDISNKLQKRRGNVPTFVELVDYYIKTSTNSEKYKNSMNRLKQIELAQIPYPTKADISEYLIKEIANIKPATANLRLKKIRSVYRHAISHGIFKGVDTTIGIKPFKGEQPRRRYLNEEEVQMLLDSLRKLPRYYLFVKISLCTGARMGTVLRIHANDINKDGSVVLYNEKTNSQYIGFLDEETMELVKDKKGYVLARPGMENEVPKYAGFRFSINLRLNRLFNPPGTHDLDKVVIHTLRHSVAAQMLRKGVPLEVVSKTLDHANISVTAKYYAKISPETVRDSVKDIWK